MCNDTLGVIVLPQKYYSPCLLLTWLAKNVSLNHLKLKIQNSSQFHHLWTEIWGCIVKYINYFKTCLYLPNYVSAIGS